MAHEDYPRMAGLTFSNGLTMIDDTDGLSSDHSKKRRNRLTLSCTECHRRKQQCDRGTPCSRCVKRGVPDQCVLEARPPYPLPGGDRPRRKKLARGVGIMASQQLVGHRPGQPEGDSRHISLAALVQQQQNRPTTYLGAGSVADFLHKIGFPSTDTTSHLGNVFPAISQDIPKEPAARPDMRPLFPSREMTDFLVNHFFGQSWLNWLYDIVHRPTFERDYDSFWATEDFENLDFVALLAVVCASALQFLLDEDVEHFLRDLSNDFGPDRDTLRVKLFNLCRLTLSTSEHQQNPTSERIQTMTLIATYSKNEGSATDNYTVIGAAVRIAQSMGMHRDGESKWGMRPMQAELRRRLWWSLYVYDKCQNFALGRPYIIQDYHCDTRLPLNLDDEELVDADQLIGRPREQPTRCSFHLADIEYAKILGRIADECFSVRAPTYRTVLDLDTALHEFERSLPTFFRSQSVVEGLERPYISYQIQILMLQINGARVSLHRPFLLCDPPDDDSDMEDEQNAVKTAEFFRTSRAACILNCKKLLSAQHLMQSTVSKAQLRWFLLAFRTFEPAATLCAAILRNPKDTQVEELDRWVVLGRDLLLNLGKENVVALEGVKALDILRTRCMAARGLPPPPNASYGDVINLPFLGASVRIQPNAPSSEGASSRATSVEENSSRDYNRTMVAQEPPAPYLPPPPTNGFHSPLPDYQWAAEVLGEPQFTISDMLGPVTMSDPLWNETPIENVFDAHFPSGVDVLGGNMDVLTSLM